MDIDIDLQEIENEQLRNNLLDLSDKDASCEEIMALINDGKTKNEVSSILGVSKDTVGKRMREYRDRQNEIKGYNFHDIRTWKMEK